MHVADASVLLAPLVATGAHHTAASAWLRLPVTPGAGVHIPALTLAEVAGACRHVTGQMAVPYTVLSHLRPLPGLHLHPLSIDAEQLSRAAQLIPVARP